MQVCSEVASAAPSVRIAEDEVRNAVNGSQVAELQLAIAARSPMKVSARNPVLLQSYVLPPRLDLHYHVSCAVPVCRSGRH